MMEAMTWARMFALLVTLALSLAAWPALAQMSPQEQFREGQKLFDSGKYEEALPFFKSAFDRTESPTARLYVARCLEKMGKLPESYFEMKATVDLARDKARKDSKYEETAKAAETELEALEGRVAFIKVGLATGSEDAVVELDGRELRDSELNERIAVMPGKIRLHARGAAGEVSQEIELDAGQKKSVMLELSRRTAQPEPISDDDDDGDDGFPITPLRAAGIGVAGLGVAGVVIFVVTGSMASSRFSQLEDECGAARCVGAQYEDVIDEGKTLSTVANVSVAVGAAAIVGGALMIIFGGPSDDEQARVVPTPDGLAVRF
jgi:hypothetical protein